MLKHLRLQNIILVERADIAFGAGLNILTGETGSGKSAVMNGLSLALGERSDPSIIRRGCEKGVVEAVFDVDGLNFLSSLLSESGIEHEPDEELIIRREITATGKSRVFINNRQVQLQLLRKVGLQLAQIVSQRANQQLFSQDYHREVTDLYGDLTRFVNDFKKSHANENGIKENLHRLIAEESQRIRESDICQSELEELDEAQLKENEDEELFAEYTLLIHSQELSEKINEINQSLSGERQPLLAALNRNKLSLDSVAQVDPTLLEASKSFQNALLEIQEVSYTLRRYGGVYRK